MDDETYNRLFEKKKARKIQKETGVKYTEALRQVRLRSISLESSGYIPATSVEVTMKDNH